VAGAQISFHLDAPEFRDAINGWMRASRDPGVLLRPLRGRLASNAQDRFDAEQDPEGQPWPGLSPAYAAMKKGAGILRESGILQRTVVGQVEGDALIVGSVMRYAAVHQFGATIRTRTAGALRFRLGSAHLVRRSVTIPARPYLGISAIDERDIFEHLTDFFAARRGV
jgi:phage virion morphogenesis protein